MRDDERKLQLAVAWLAMLLLVGMITVVLCRSENWHEHPWEGGRIHE